MRIKAIVGIFGLLSILACSTDEIPDLETRTENTGGSWLVPFEDILYWGDPTDEILSIENPEFILVSESNWNVDDRMLVSFYEGIVRIYPIIILEEHEIINDRIGEYHYAVSYCPITGSGMSWNRTIDGSITEFGVSGMLFHDNLVPYDRETESYWSQMRMLCINGELIESVAEPGMMFETSFDIVNTHFQDAEILVKPEVPSTNPNPGPVRYKDIADDSEPGGTDEGILNPGEYYYGAISGDRVLIFSMEMFDDGIKVLSTSFYGSQLLVVGSQSKNLIVSFRISGNIGAQMTALEDQFPIVMEDSRGNVFDVFGQVVSGPDQGKALSPTRAYRAKGFAWESIFNRVNVFGE